VHPLRRPLSPRAPSGFDAFPASPIAAFPSPPSAARAFMTVPALCYGYLTFPIRSRAFRRWFFDQCLSDYETIPTAQTFNSILRNLAPRPPAIPTPAAFAPVTHRFPQLLPHSRKKSSSTSPTPTDSSSKSPRMAGRSPPVRVSPSRLFAPRPPNPPATPIPKSVHRQITHPVSTVVGANTADKKPIQLRGLPILPIGEGRIPR
jgi:hypothetical protein